MKAYCLRDCLVLRTVMEYYHRQCNALTHGRRPYGWMTAASTAINLCFQHLDENYGRDVRTRLFPDCKEPDFPAWIREGYKGATPLLDPAIRNHELHDVHVFDVNSMYPHQMRSALLPTGKPLDDHPLDMETLMDLKDRGFVWIAKVKMLGRVKEGHRATFMLKRQNADGDTLAWAIDDFTDGGYQVIDSVTIDLLMRDYDDLAIEVLDSLVFVAYRGVLKGFVDHWYHVKEEAGKRGDKSLKGFAKLLLNSLYGKFGTNPEHGRAEYVYQDDMIRVRECDDVEVDEHPYYLPVAVFITAYARDMISRTCSAIGWEHVAYTDTDSVHIHGLTAEECIRRLQAEGFEVDANAIGAYDYESRWDDALYVRNKGYFHFNEDGSKEIRMAGANGFEGFESLADVYDQTLTGMQRRGYRVYGGILLIEHETTIDTKIDMELKTRVKVQGFGRLGSIAELQRLRAEVFAKYGVL